MHARCPGISQVAQKILGSAVHKDWTSSVSSRLTSGLNQQNIAILQQFCQFLACNCILTDQKYACLLEDTQKISGSLIHKVWTSLVSNMAN